jgi:hypothetical protein
VLLVLTQEGAAVLKYPKVERSRRDAGATKPFAATRWFFPQIESRMRCASPTFEAMFLLDYAMILAKGSELVSGRGIQNYIN